LEWVSCLSKRVARYGPVGHATLTSALGGKADKQWRNVTYSTRFLCDCNICGPRSRSTNWVLLDDVGCRET
jgi:hypothetical protein